MLVPCPDCGAHRREGPAPCPHCDDVRRPRIAAALLALAFTACAQKEQSLYGVAVEDADGDGYDNTQDCDDGDETVHPDAEETAGDGVDSNCDGEDDT